MSKTIGRIDREGVINFYDASLAVWEDGIPSLSTPDAFKTRDEWGRRFKREVFARIVQALNRLGWKVVIPPTKQNSPTFTLGFRDCSKGDLKGELQISGRSIKFDMWQGVNCPTRPDHGGRYEHNKEACMPYVLRLEMERTRLRIRDYLLNVFTGYSFKPPKISSPNPDPLAYFNGDWGAGRFHRGPDGWPSDKEINSWSRTDKDGARLNHGDVRWCRDHKGRLIRGRVYGGINGMWMMVYGPGARDHTHKNANEYFSYRQSETPMKAINQRERRKRLEREMSQAVHAMNFKRAEVLKNILFPTNEQLFHLMKNGAYFGIGYSGYTSDRSNAGKYTKDELKPYASCIKNGSVQAIPIDA